MSVLKVPHFGDGGVFPEIHIKQYPLGMAMGPTEMNRVIPVSVDPKGNVLYDAIVRQNENSSNIVYSKYDDMMPKIAMNDVIVVEEKEIEETAAETKAALEKILNARMCVAQPKQSSDSTFIKYTTTGAKQGRMIRMEEMPVDSLEPAKFKVRRVPRASGSPPVPVLHSPPRAVTVQEKQDSKIPPCISNWKNAKGYTIPLDKRLEHEKDREINADQFNSLDEALRAADRKAREAIELRSKVQKEMARKEKDRKEKELCALAQKARTEGSGMDDKDCPVKETKEEREERLQRDEMRVERKRERASEARAAASGKKTKMAREREHDVSEKIALGQANVTAGGRGEVMYDQRLFNQDKGMSSGFVTDDQYNLYDKGLFSTSLTLSTLYRRPNKKDTDDQQLDNEEADIFDLDKFIGEVYKGNKA